MKYSEQEHSQNVDWFVELSNPPSPLSNRHYALINLASKWVTCAVGQEDCRVPRKDNGCPEDSELQRLGSRFYELIIGARWSYATETLEEIERRSMVVLNRHEAPIRYKYADLLPPGT